MIDRFNLDSQRLRFSWPGSNLLLHTCALSPFCPVLMLHLWRCLDYIWSYVVTSLSKNRNHFILDNPTGSSKSIPWFNIVFPRISSCNKTQILTCNNFQRGHFNLSVLNILFGDWFLPWLQQLKNRSNGKVLKIARCCQVKAKNILFCWAKVNQKSPFLSNIIRSIDCTRTGNVF